MAPRWTSWRSNWASLFSSGPETRQMLHPAGLGHRIGLGIPIAMGFASPRAGTGPFSPGANLGVAAARLQPAA